MNKRRMFVSGRTSHRRLYSDYDNESDRADRINAIDSVRDWAESPMVYISHLNHAGFEWTSGEVRRAYGVPAPTF